MATVNFYLDRADRFEKYQIFMVYQHKGTKFKIYSKERTDKKAWDPVKQRIKRNYAGYLEVNRNIDQIEAIILKIVRHAGFNSVDPMSSYVKSELHKEIQAPENKENKVPDFHDEFQTFIDSSMLLKSHNTIRSYKSTLVRIQEYESKVKRKISFETIDIEFYEKFRKYLISDCHLLNNSIGKHIKILKTFLNYATEKEISDKMIKNKTKWALCVFESANKLNYPDYIMDAVEWCNE